MNGIAMRAMVVASALVCALLHVRTASAQQGESATFYVTVGADTLTVERMTRTANRLQFQLFDMKRRSRAEVDAALDSTALISAATALMFGSDRDTAPAARVTVRFVSDSVGFERNGTWNWIRVGAGALPNVNPSAALLEQTLLRARAMGGDTAKFSYVYLPSGPAVPLAVTWPSADSAVIAFAGVSIRAAFSGGRLLGAFIPSQNVRISRGPATSGAVPGRKSFAPPADAPYSAQDVVVHTKAGLTLTGTLTLPRRATPGPVPAVVTITGSGTEDRDETVAGLPAYRPFYQLADTLGRRGIAVLRLDDRGAGGSDVGPPTATTEDFADDIRAAVAYLRGRPEIDPRRVGLVGHSEGATIAMMIGASDSALAAVVVMGGTVSSGREIVTFQQRYVVDSMAHLVGQAREAALARSARATDSIAATLPWMRFFLEYQAGPTAARVRAPVLIVHGEKDYQVPVVEAEKTATAMRNGGNRDVTVRTFPSVNHLFVNEAGVGFSYEKLPSYAVRPEVLGAIADWLVMRLRP